MFLFVFYFQGVKGDDPIKAGIKLAPMAIGMLIASPLAGIWADRHGSRMLAALGMVVSAVGAGRDDDARRRTRRTGRAGAVAVRRRRRLGHVQLAQHRGDDGHGAGQPPRRSPPARGRCCRTPARSSRSRSCWRSSPPRCPSRSLFKIFSGLDHGPLGPTSSTRSSPTCTRRCGCWPRRRWSARSSRCCGPGMSTRRRGPPSRQPDRASCGSARSRALGGHDAAHGPLLRGDRAAARAPTSAPAGAPSHLHAEDVERLRELLRLQASCSGVSLDELKAAGRGRGRRAPTLRAQFRASDDPDERQRELLERGARRTSTAQLELVAPPARRAREARGRAGRARERRRAQAPARARGRRCVQRGGALNAERRPRRRPRRALRRARSGRRRLLRGRRTARSSGCSAPTGRARRRRCAS